MNRMSSEWKAKWLEALRSGAYTQAREAMKLHQPESYCCLGVLRELVKPGCTDLQGGEGGDEYLPDDIAGEVGVPLHVQERLAHLNDGYLCEPHSFKQIADYIEQNL
jgi:hypothetical protein